MKKLLICTAILFLGCASKKTGVSQNQVVLQLESECPKAGTCRIEVFENKKMQVNLDEFGSVYYKLEDDLQKKVIKYSYSKTVKGDIQDAGYREEIVFELDNFENQDFENADLQKTQMLFGRFCYCKGQTGNYKVGSGKLSIQDKKASLSFTVSEVPQLIKTITFDIK
ncbi:hypothetical protein FNO01nite_21120 [Flavobacterium noncentrifugens]|uniref:Lipoprotein n=1 Tax=Flavobacterium noncentrifugens TaxID=1128970 RepID=A0A1G9AGQ1_9FLAO|nr:hypothetical protein [Flavobacterium noncentrifugens]GEP51440.1 hypothetical protein FNO01nite_21120 [Flavobacterium noncentrifugens]SDK26413.1 hypothetical protein SAMN04487935_2887 [Flavobacterium noncentrifugens]